MEVGGALQGRGAAGPPVSRAPLALLPPDRPARPTPPLLALRAAGLREPGAHRRGAPPPPPRAAERPLCWAPLLLRGQPSAAARPYKPPATLLRCCGAATPDLPPARPRCAGHVWHGARAPRPHSLPSYVVPGRVPAAHPAGTAAGVSAAQPPIGSLQLGPASLTAAPPMLLLAARPAPPALPPQVLKCRNRETGEIVAIKKFKSRIDGENADAAQARTDCC